MIKNLKAYSNFIKSNYLEDMIFQDKTYSLRGETDLITIGMVTPFSNNNNNFNPEVPIDSTLTNA